MGSALSGDGAHSCGEVVSYLSQNNDGAAITRLRSACYQRELLGRGYPSLEPVLSSEVGLSAPLPRAGFRVWVRTGGLWEGQLFGLQDQDFNQKEICRLLCQGLRVSTCVKLGQ